MDIPVKKLVRLLQPDQDAELRAAATLVLAELGGRDAAIAGEIVARLDDESPDVRLNAIKAVGKLRIEKALPTLLERIAHGGPEANLSAEAAAQLGAKAIKALQDLMPKVAPGLRRYIAAALTSAGTTGADAAGVTVLLDKDPQVAASAANAIIAKIPTFTPDRKAALADELVAIASNKKHPLPTHAELPIIRILAALNVPAAATVFWDRAGPPHTADVRAAALQAVGGWVEKPSKEQWQKLFASAIEADFCIAAPALMVLNRLPASDKQLADWLKLLHAPDVAARRLAMDKVGDRDTADVATALMDQLSHPDRSVHDAARSRLVKLKAGRKVLTSALLEAATPDDAWRLARIVAPFVKEFSADLREQIVEQACGHLDAGDHRADALLFLLREADPAALRDQLFERAVALRKKKKYPAAMMYLKTVARDPSIGFPVRLELALCGLKTSAKSLEASDRGGDPSLRNFASLLEQDADQLLKEVEKAKWLDPEELFYVGFHFAEQMGRPRQFGADVLKAVLKRVPKGELAKSAKNKLKATGME